MGLLKMIKAQFGLSNTATNNFTLDASSSDGTMKLARGNAGATTQDILTVDAAGKVDLPQLVRTLGSSGSYELPGGLILKWGVTAGQPNDFTIVYSSPFSTSAYLVVASMYGAPASGVEILSVSTSAITTAGFNVHPRYRNSTGAGVASQQIMWVAIGK